jgi:hypothetical protein
VQALPEQWINAANLTLLTALRRSAPQAIDWTEMLRNRIRVVKRHPEGDW